MDNDALAFGEEHEPHKVLRHPLVALLHVIFRVLSIVIYLFCGFSQSGFIGSFVIIVLLLSIDFWVVKNITGRLMVGLRWWNYIDEDGKSHWVFEARKGSQQWRVSAVESQIFWGGLIAPPIVWCVFLLVALMKVNFKWMMIIFIALSLSGSNLYGYIKCKIGKSEGITGSFKNFASGIMQRQMVSNGFGPFLDMKGKKSTNSLQLPRPTPRGVDALRKVIEKTGFPLQSPTTL